MLQGNENMDVCGISSLGSHQADQVMKVTIQMVDPLAAYGFLTLRPPSWQVRFISVLVGR